MFRRGARVAAAVLVVLALGGCAGGTPELQNSPATSPAAAFQSEDEALEAARRAYEGYLQVADQVSREGGADAERYASVAAGDALEEGLASAQQYREAGAHMEGQTTIASVELQQLDQNETEVTVLTYVCVDLTEVDVIDGSGNSLVTPDRPPRVLLEVELAAPSASRDLKVTRRSVWANNC